MMTSFLNENILELLRKIPETEMPDRVLQIAYAKHECSLLLQSVLILPEAGFFQFLLRQQRHRTGIPLEAQPCLTFAANPQILFLFLQMLMQLGAARLQKVYKSLKAFERDRSFEAWIDNE